MSDKLFAVFFPFQKEQIGAWCWGDGCGKGGVGALDLGESMAVGCTEEVCPYEEKRMDEPFGEVNGADVYVRKLRDLEVDEKQS